MKKTQYLEFIEFLKQPDNNVGTVVLVDATMKNKKPQRFTVIIDEMINVDDYILAYDDNMVLLESDFSIVNVKYLDYETEEFVDFLFTEGV